jgi:thioredoxin 1
MGKFTKQATDREFGGILKSGGVSVIDFWAEWCGPCRTLEPHVDALAEEFQGRASVFKLNVDENPETPARFHVRGLPSVLIFKDGQLVDQVVGAVPRAVLKEAIERHLT